MLSWQRAILFSQRAMLSSQWFGRVSMSAPATKNRRSLLRLAVCAVGIAVVPGCASLLDRDSAEEREEERLKKLLKVPAPPDLIREAAVVKGMQSVRVDGVGLVNSLPHSGGPAQPSGLRDMLLEEMKRNDVPSPNEYLERDDNALVQVYALVPPGARRGDIVDLQVKAPIKTEATDLHGGWLLDTRLRHQQRLRGVLRSSEVMMVGTGPMVTRADHQGDRDETKRTQGVVLSGGVVQVDRKLGLILRPEYQHVKLASAIAAAINRRFYFFDGSTRRGIAKALEDDYIELEVHPRYRGNEYRMVEVVRALGVAPESSDTQKRLVDLAEKLRQPSTAADAALQLEGLGESSIPTLIDAAGQSNPELRFYAAEALAYLDRHEAIEPLIASIRADRAFRAPALEALRGLQHHGVVDPLYSLMNDSSLETRYGAFTALRRRADAVDSLAGENLYGHFRLYQMPSSASPAVVISLRRSPEIVLMGDLAPLKIDTVFRGPLGWLVKESATPGRYILVRFRPGEEESRTEIEPTPVGLIRGMTRLGGVYGDVINVLRTAKTGGVLVDQLALDPLPTSQRTYYRESDQAAGVADDTLNGGPQDNDLLDFMPFDADDATGSGKGPTGDE